MTLQSIATLRLLHQQIRNNGESAVHTPKELVAWMGAMQAQDYPMAKWAVGLRLPSATNEAVEQAITGGDILRTHILRPTWHFVAAEDIRWMLTLTAPHIRRSMVSRERKLELTDDVIKRSNACIESFLRGKQRTREEIVAELAKAGIPTNENRAAHLMMHAELSGIVCSGALQGKQQGKQTLYALLDERVPPASALTRDEAIYELTKRYFLSHGPATAQDYAWWSGLPAADVRSGLEMVKPLLTAETFSGQQFWFGTSAEPLQTSMSDKDAFHEEHLHILPAFDEFIVSYKDRSASLNPAYLSRAIMGGIFKPTIIANGAVVGTWKQNLKNSTTHVEITFFQAAQYTNAQTVNAINAAMKRFGRFLQMKISTNMQN